MMSRTAAGAATLALMSVTAGCAQNGAAGTGRTSPESAAASAPATLPTIDRRPSAPPLGPTDAIKKTTWVVGTVTTGGKGPCYGLVTDDGKQYALHTTDGTTLTKGTRVKVNTATSKLKIDCGPGKLVEMVAAVPVG
jgi:hypothetical protein